MAQLVSDQVEEGTGVEGGTFVQTSETNDSFVETPETIGGDKEISSKKLLDSSEANIESEKQKEDWQRLLSDSLKENEQISKFETLDALANEFLALSGKEVGKTEQDTVILPEKYEWSGKEESQMPEGLEDRFIQFASENKLSKSQFDGLNNIVEELAVEVNSPEVQAEIEKQEEETFNKNREILEKEWGEDYTERLEKVQYAVIREFGEDGIEHLESLGVGNDAKFLLMLSKFSDFITEDSYHSGSKSTSLQSVEAKIDKILGDSSGAYFDQEHPEHKRAVSEMDILYQQVYPT